MTATPDAGTRASGYRRDIDGLRALAVLPVVLYHAGFPATPGGYVGVDVFFVISGFLITGILLDDQRPFSIVEFYNRRVRRIFPALFAMLAVVTALALVILTPGDLRQYAVSLGATATFCSNIYFFLTSGYFATEAASKPLLHTWSLAVEEQFYIGWPLLLWMMRGSTKRGIQIATLALTAVSFGLSVWATPHHADAAFYSPLTRVWELFLGAALAIRPVHLASRALRSFAATAGLALIGYAVFAFNEQTQFPGYAALAPCLGAALIIMGNAQRDTWVAHALSWRPAVFIGLISYSLYLWHWPVLVLAEYVIYRPLTAFEAAGLVALAILLAALSWRFVERPFRRRSANPGAWRRSLPAGVAVIAVTLAMAGPAYLTGGFPQRAPQVLRFEQAANDQPDAWNCEPGQNQPGCRFGRADKAPSILLWGDSHAGAISPGFDAAAATAGRAGLRFSRSRCAPLLGVTRLDAGGVCRPYNDEALRRLSADPGIETVVLAARWSLAAEGVRYGEEEGGPNLLIDERHPKPGLANNRIVLADGLDRTVAAIRRVRPGARIVLIGQAPDLLYDAPRCMARAGMYGRSDADCRYLPADLAHQRLAYAKTVLKDVAQRHGAELYMLDEKTCRGDRCDAVMDGVILYRDNQHLSVSGAKLLTRDFPMTRP